MIEFIIHWEYSGALYNHILILKYYLIILLRITLEIIDEFTNDNNIIIIGISLQTSSPCLSNFDAINYKNASTKT